MPHILWTKYTDLYLTSNTYEFILKSKNIEITIICLTTQG